MISPTDIYLKKISEFQWTSFPEQLSVLKVFDDASSIHHIHFNQSRKISARIKKVFRRYPKPYNIYCYGPVGRGKTLLMDCFFQSLPQGTGRRQHFYQFMRQTHQQLQNIKQANPLEVIAKSISEQHQVCCLDEFLVDDIGNAMILGGLIQALNKYGVSVVTNANLPPDKLYESGIQRLSFLPTIEFIKQSFKVLYCETPYDFRKKDKVSTLFFKGTTDEQHHYLNQCFTRLSPKNAQLSKSIQVAGRDILTQAQSSQVLWIDFHALCLPPRASQDYLYLCEHYPYILIGQIPKILPQDKALLHNFMSWVDIAYDHQTSIILASDHDLENIVSHDYPGYTRTLSRLTEMLAKPEENNDSLYA